MPNQSYSIPVQEGTAASNVRSVPFCVDLDGTLVRDDTLWLLLIQSVKVAPFVTLRAFFALLTGGKAKAKRLLAKHVPLDVSTLLFNEQILDCVKAARSAGSPVWLVTASDQLTAEQIANHLGLFDRVIGSDGVQNLRGPLKAKRLVEECGHGGFDYLGDGDTDLPVWKAARKVSALLRHKTQATALRGHFPDADVALLPRLMHPVLCLIHLLRVKQWSKNILVLVPLFTAHLVGSIKAWTLAGTGTLVFCLGCSAVYICNDLLDLTSDRRNPRKRNRPTACGAISIPASLGLASVCLAASLFIALTRLPLGFLVTFLVYLTLTFAYSLGLKRALLLDVFLLAGFYVLRVVAGAAAVQVPLSNWLLSFSAFTFLSLGLLKRYGELAFLKVHGQERPVGRKYENADMALLSASGVGCGVGAAVMLALFVESASGVVQYTRPQYLWICCPTFLFWITRLWLLAGRGTEVDDPITFALGDPISYVVAIIVGASFILSL
jgi:4-hydroxybenzoate polyprenyltransferase/phosphoserine phosphatase